MRLNWAERIAVNNPLREQVLKWEVSWLKGKMPLGAGSVVVEVGCGRGVGAISISERFRPSGLILLDLDPVMISKARLLFKKRDAGAHERVLFVCGDAFRLPFASCSLDGVFALGVLHHVEDWRGALGEIHRVLKEDGLYGFEEIFPALYQNTLTKRILLHPSENRFDGPALREALRNTGFELMCSKELKGMGMLGVCRKERLLSASPLER
jgi:ubiquinone/menaquinone biosynthesis C-methylase UbiE